MGIAELLLIAVGLSMDAFAVSVCKGLGMQKLRYGQALIIGLFFGGFQALMPLIGWAIGSQFEDYITAYDHWVAFILLAFIGGKMLIEAVREGNGDNACEFCENNFSVKELFVLAIATSIDALAAGITFAVIENTNIGFSIMLIGIITFALSFVGVIIGNNFGSKFKKKAEISGGLILILIGVKILLEHLGIINF